jgi:MinD-like ATPase involved in chromosome partitioning or flagellar assembly
VFTTVAVHSMRAGAGRSRIVASLAAILACDGHRVAVVDLDDEHPSLPMLFGIDDERLRTAVRDYFYDRTPIESTVFDASRVARAAPGSLWLLPGTAWKAMLTPASPTGEQPAFGEALHQIAQQREFEILLIDSTPGVDETALLTMAICDVLVEIVRPDAQEMHATGVALELARELGAGRIVVAVSQTPATDGADLRQQIEAAYRAPVAAILPLSPGLAGSFGAAPFAVLRPDDPWSLALGQLAREVASVAARTL